MKRLRHVFLSSAIVGLATVAIGAMRTDDRVSDDAITFADEERTRILQHSPLPEPPIDATNRFVNDERAARFGQFIFHDTRFSSNNAVSCATCHDPTKGFGDGRRLPFGIRVIDRHSQSLWNMAYNRWFFWDGRADSLWSQALIPFEHVDEMGGDRTAIAKAIQKDRSLRKAYEANFGRMPSLNDSRRFPARAMPVPASPGDPRDAAWQGMSESDRHAVNEVFANVGKALAAYQVQLVSRDSPFDRFAEGLRDGDASKMNAISDSAKRGLKIFVGRGNCRLCHSGPNFTDGEFHSVGPRVLGGGEPTDAGRFKGIDSLKSSPFNAAGAFSDDPAGPVAQRLGALVNPPENWGQFKTPSLRSVATSAPYMHEGQYLTLDEVIEHYSTLADAGPNGLAHHREKILQPLNLSEQEKADLKAFLESLTGAPLPASLLKKPKSP